jgi:redox-sensing transcriptional repressor
MPVKEPPDSVSEATTHRLSILLRSLRILEGDGVDTISSQQLADRFGLNAAQIRKDLAQFGEFGVRGVGYRVDTLKQKLRSVMGLDRARALVILGAGHLGQALADSGNFNTEGFRVVALFDNDGRKIGGRSRTGVPIRDVAELPDVARAESVEVGVLAVPAEAVPPAAVVLRNAGVKAILNFAPITLAAVPGLEVKNVDLTLFLENLSYRLAAADARQRPRRA